MLNFNIREIIESKSSFKFSAYPKIIQKLITHFITYILNLKEINNSYNVLKTKKNFDFIDELFEYLDFSYSIKSKDKNKIPSEGKLVIVANHPLGALDGLALLKAVSEVRKDVKIVANDLLIKIDNLSELFLGYDVFTLKAQKDNIVSIERCLIDDEAVIFFPAAEVSRFTLKGIKDKVWQKGALKIAKKFKAPILPMYIEGKNSFMFYLLSIIFPKFSIFLLPREIFNKRGKFVTLKIGDPIPYSSINNDFLSNKLQNKILRKHVNHIGKNKSGIIKSEKTIIHPIDVKSIKDELSGAENLVTLLMGNEYILSQGAIQEIFLKKFPVFAK